MMRLLHRVPSGDFELKSFPENPPPYAILSHTWIEGQEVTFNELEDGVGKEKSGYAKIRFCGERAEADDLEYFWVDTCCIDKSSVVELSTAINSMFRWYKQSKKCYVYLPDVSIPEEVIGVKIEAEAEAWLGSFRKSRWFTRGWTLQELVAPASVDFFSKEGRWLGNKMTLEQDIHSVTKVPIQALRGQDLNDFSDNERIRWVQTRTTTMKEDKVYCLLGIFGIFLPLIYGEGEIYAMSRLKDEVRRMREGQGNKSLEDLFTTPSLPFSRNEFFVGREDHLEALETLLVPGTQRQMTIYGLGGTGKSSLALHFAYQSLASHQALKTFLVPALSRESFELAYREIGIRLRIPGITDDKADVKKLVNEALSSGRLGQWLLIIDNADDIEVLLGMTNNHPTSSRLSDILPHSDQGAILFTTRDRKTAVQLTQSRILELKELDKSESETLLRSKIANQALCQDPTAIEQLLELLEYLPLAIVHAAAFINSNDITVSAYVSLFQDPEAKAELLNEQFEDPIRYREMDSTIAKTWHISFNQICKQDPLAAMYLSFMACVDRINIPATLLPSGKSLIEQVKSIGTLTAYAMITERQNPIQAGQDRFFDMHRLVHITSSCWLDEKGERTSWVGTAAARVAELTPYGDYEGKEKWIRYLPHAVYLAGLSDHLDIMTRALLLERVGRCQSSLGQYAAAETTHRQSLSLTESFRGPNHQETLLSMGNLVFTLYKQGKHGDSEPISRQVLERSQKVLGDDHLITLESKNQLAAILERQGKFGEAELLNRQILAQQEEKYGPNHENTMPTKNILAGILQGRGNYEEAELIIKETLSHHENTLGYNHPYTLSIRNNLAGALQCQQKYEQAELIIRPTLEQQEQVLGNEHLDTMSSKSTLAFILGCQAKYEEGELLSREILAQQSKILGPKHPETLKSMINLTFILEGQHKTQEVESIRRQTLTLRKEVQGNDHPDTLMTMYCLAHIIAKQGRFTESLAMFKEAHPACVSVLGENHQSTRLCHQYYSEALAMQKMHSFTGPNATLNHGAANTRTGMKLKFSRGLAKFGIKNSKSLPK